MLKFVDGNYVEMTAEEVAELKRQEDATKENSLTERLEAVVERLEALLEGRS